MSGVAFVTFITAAACMVSVALTAPQSFKEAKMPASCEGKNYCHNRTDDYPQTLIDKILENLDYKIEQGSFVNEIEDRVSIGSDIVNDDCERDFKFEPIHEIVDSNGLVRFVIQSGDKFMQKIKTETCKNPGRLYSSKYYEEAQLSMMNLSCTEKKMDYWFQVLSLDGSSFEHVAVEGGLPVCCSCRLTV